MKLDEINRHLTEGKFDDPGILPHVDNLKEVPYVFNFDFGLSHLPEEPGLLLIRGPRQYGKSTWLEMQIKNIISRKGPGSALYIDGDAVKDDERLMEYAEELMGSFNRKAEVKYLFIDEITAIEHWERSLKRLFDRGKLRGVLVVSTGSKASDLRHGAERLPGRKGKLDRTTYFFTPISYLEFERVCGNIFGPRTLIAYLLSGGCPIACNELARHGFIPEYIITMIRDWIYGECMASGRVRSSLLATFDILIKSGGQPLGQAKLAREAGLANNTVAAGYIELLADLMTVVPSYAWDPSRNISVKRKPSKFHFINVLAAVAWHPAKIRSIADFEHLPEEMQSKFYEWLTAQELWRCAAIRGDEMPEQMNFWSSGEHEIDFVVKPDYLIEVKRGLANPIEFKWFPKIFPKAALDIITTSKFETEQIRGISMEDFLRQDYPETVRR